MNRPVDIPGHNVTWVDSNQRRYFGTVTKVFYKPGPHKKYPNTCLRQLNKKMVIEMADNRKITISGEQDDLVEMKMIAATED